MPPCALGIDAEHPHGLPDLRVGHDRGRNVRTATGPLRQPHVGLATPGHDQAVCTDSARMTAGAVIEHREDRGHGRAVLRGHLSGGFRQGLGVGEGQGFGLLAERVCAFDLDLGTSRGGLAGQLRDVLRQG